MSSAGETGGRQIRLLAWEAGGLPAWHRRPRGEVCERPPLRSAADADARCDRHGRGRSPDRGRATVSSPPGNEALRVGAPAWGPWVNGFPCRGRETHETRGTHETRRTHETWGIRDAGGIRDSGGTRDAGGTRDTRHIRRRIGHLMYLMYPPLVTVRRTHWRYVCVPWPRNVSDIPFRSQGGSVRGIEDRSGKG